MRVEIRVALFVLAFAAGAGLMWQLERDAPNEASASPEPPAIVTGPRATNPGAVKVELFVMSQCPYGVQAEDAFAEVVEKLGPDLDLRFEYIGSIGEGGALESMHGPPEVMGNLVQVCAMAQSPKWFEFVQCQNKDWKHVDTNWKSCAQQVGIDAEALEKCATGEEGKKLLSASYAKANAKGAQGSPTIHIGGQDYQGGRDPQSLMRAICSSYPGAKPKGCDGVAELAKVNVTILSDKRCGADCDTARLEGQVRSVVAKPVLATLDYSSPEGRALYDAVPGSQLPAVILDRTLDDDEAAKAAFERGGLKQIGEHRVLSVGEWSPACADDKGCELEACKKKLFCRAETPKKLEVFVMSQCPYGVIGLDAMREVLDNFKKHGETIDFAVHFIGSGSADNLQSMHGQPEVDEDIREACAAKHYAKDLKFMDYVWCRNKSIQDGNWQACTGGSTGIDTQTMTKCFEGSEGKELLARSFAFSNELGIGGSPTWLANGKHQFSGVDAETIKTRFCEHNKLKGCDMQLTGQPPRPSAPGGAAAAQPGCE